MSRNEELRQQAIGFHQAGRLAEAEAAYKDLMRAFPAADVAANLGALLRGQGRLEEAERLYHQALQAFPHDATLLANACNLLRDLGKASDTVPLLERALQREPTSFPLRQGLALSLHHCGRIGEALQLLPALLAERPEDVNLLLELGACQAKRGEHQQALQAFEKALKLDPANPQIQANRIAMLVDLGRLEDAAQALAQAPLRGQHPRLIGAEATLLSARNELQAALELQLGLTELEPHVADHWLCVAASQIQLGQMVAPLQSLQRGLKLAPQRHDLMLMLGKQLLEHGQHQRGLELLQAGVDHPDANDLAHGVFQFAAAGARLVPAAQLRQRVAAWEQRRALKPSELWRDRIRDPNPDRPLRVGYLSPDYCNHPVGRFMEPLFAGHNRQQVEVIGLSCGKRQGPLQERLRACCDGWHDLRHGDDLAVARFLADLQLDVLVELGGYTAEQRLRPLTARPAPIQLSYLGYPVSTYLSCIDGWIGDRVVFGPLQEQERGPREQLLRLNRCYLAYPAPADAPTPERTAPDQRFRFGSFNHSRKLSDRSLDLFASVLQAVPESLLVLKSATFVEPAERDRIAARLERRGVAPERLELLSWAEATGDHLSLYGRMDAAIDTVPYSGTTTTCEALWMGVPVLTLLGESMVERQSAAVLAGADLGAAIAGSLEDLILRAQRIAARGPRQQRERQQLRDHVAASALTDTAGLARELEQLYRQLWQQRCLADRL